MDTTSALATFDAPGLTLDRGSALAPFTLAYETYGMLNAKRSNAILVCHGLTGDQYAASPHPLTGKPGWWHGMIGPGLPIDTDRFFVIAANTLGGCMGSTGPASTEPGGNRPYALRFPVITIPDMVRAQVRLIDHLKIDQLLSVVGGSMGGMQALEWAARYPRRVRSVIPIAAAARHSAQNIAFHELGRQAIMSDPEWCEGNYLEAGTLPRKGLGVARMAAHITYLSDAALQRKFGRSLQDRQTLSFSFDADFQVESYLRHQGTSFVDRFDANSYLYITRAMDYFDLAKTHGGTLKGAFRDTAAPVLLISFSSDWHYPTAESKAVFEALQAAGVRSQHLEIVSDKGHDAFLLDEPDMAGAIARFLSDRASERGIL